ncbi:hypothetical protein pb186bvf_014634 [Paramecium bursaria]
MSIAIKEMEFRKKRGERIKQLMNNEQKDDFWDNNKYFNKEINNSEDESYQQKQGEKSDSYDSDFGDSSSESDQKSAKETETKKINQEKKQRSFPESKRMYIHDLISQDYLIREAVLTQIMNKISLEQLIKIEEDRKVIDQEHKIYLEGPIIRKINNSNGTTIQFIEHKPEIFEKSFKPIRQKSNKKYKDPKTGQRFNTIAEYKAIKHVNKFQERINQLQKKIT